MTVKLHLHTYLKFNFALYEIKTKIACSLLLFFEDSEYLSFYFMENDVLYESFYARKFSVTILLHTSSASDQLKTCFLRLEIL